MSSALAGGLLTTGSPGKSGLDILTALCDGLPFQPPHFLGKHTLRSSQENFTAHGGKVKARRECSSWRSGLRMKAVMVRMMVMAEVMEEDGEEGD